MDPITQATLGGVVGELVLGKKLGGKAMAWGMVFGTLPDLDIFLYPFIEEVDRIRWHRGISHSILMMFAASFLLMKPLARFHRKHGVAASEFWWLIFLAWSTHVLIDVFTSYGTQVLEPFSDYRAAFNNLFIIDLFFTLPLLICVLIRGWRSLGSRFQLFRWLRQGADPDEKPESEPLSKRTAWIAISLSCLYVVFSFAMKLRATDQIAGRMKDEIPDGELISTTPTPFNAILWRGLVETDDGYWVTYWSLFDKAPAKFDYFAKNHELAAEFEGNKWFENLKWFAKDHWVARPSSDGKVAVIDMRFGERRDPVASEMEPAFRWELVEGEAGEVKAVSDRPKTDNIGAALGLIWDRLTGKTDRWESIEPF